jgi:hypothetical protein
MRKNEITELFMKDAVIYRYKTNLEALQCCKSHKAIMLFMWYALHFFKSTHIHKFRGKLVSIHSSVDDLDDFKETDHGCHDAEISAADGAAIKSVLRFLHI